MTPYEFIAKWRASELKERSAAQEHFIDLCRLLGEPTPAEADPTGDHYCFERGARKDTGGDGWADVWKRHHFAWEYKGPHANLDAAFTQLRQYALALENPPLLIVSDMLRFRIHTKLDQQRQPDIRVRAGRPGRRGRARQAEVGALGPGTPAARRDAADAHRARRGSLRVTGARIAGARPRPAGGRAFRQPAGVLHVRRGRRPAAERHVHADARAGAAAAGSVRRACPRPVRRDGDGRPDRLRGGRLVRRRAVRRRFGAAAGEDRDRDGARDGGPGLVGDRPVDPGHAVRARAGSPQAGRSLERTTPTATRSCSSSSR